MVGRTTICKSVCRVTNDEFQAEYDDDAFALRSWLVKPYKCQRLLELTCFVLHSILRTYQGEGAQLPHPQDDIVLAHLGVQVLIPWRPP